MMIQRDTEATGDVVRLVVHIRNRAAPSGLLPTLSIQRFKFNKILK